MALTSSLAKSDVCVGVEVDVSAPGVVVTEIGTLVSRSMANCGACSFSLSSFSS